MEQWCLNVQIIFFFLQTTFVHLFRWSVGRQPNSTARIGRKKSVSSPRSYCAVGLVMLIFSPVPDDYLTNAQIREKLPPVKLNKLSEDVLFYLFYNCPGEVYQLAAACELYQRDWRFHKSDGNWLTRSQYGGVKEQTGSYEKGQYNVFDPLQWRKIPKELKLECKELEERP
ncbi:NOT2 / NOT3 / NOT5 family protein, partial [Ancylostoma caninum]